MSNTLDKLEKDQGIKMVPAEAQAILWYYEKALYAEYGSGKEHGQAKGLKGVGSYVESRGRDPVSEIRTRSTQGEVPNERDGQTDRSGGTGDVGGGAEAGAGAGEVLGSAAADADIDSQFREDSSRPENLFPFAVLMQEKQVNFPCLKMMPITINE